MKILAITTTLEYIKFERNSSGLKICKKVQRKRKSVGNQWFSTLLVEISGIEPLSS